MKQQEELPVEKNSPAPKFRFWFTVPEFVTIQGADLAALVPASQWKSPVPADLAIELPAGKVFAGNVPRIPLRLLAELLPDHLSPSDGSVKLPAARLAANYRLVQHQEELPAEKAPSPVEILPPEIFVESESPTSPPEPESPAAVIEPLEIPAPVAPPEIDSETVPAIEIPKPALEPVVEAFVPDEKPAAQEPEPRGTLDVPQELPKKVLPRRGGFFGGLPIFRRKPAVVHSEPVPAAEPAAELPRVVPEVVVVPEVRDAAPEISKELPTELPAVTVESVIADPEPIAVPAPIVSFSSVPMLETEHVSGAEQSREIADQEPLQSLFLTEENLTLARVLELCGGLPGINSCVLSQGSVVVGSHNAPDGVDLVSMSAHASNMLRAMRDSTARMGVGTVPAVTLHTEKGVISFFNREDLTMLVFHKDRGFVPGVREKMAAVLGELSKARLTLPVGGEEAGI